MASPDHGLLLGLTDDDHPHYLDTVRHDADPHTGVGVLDHGLLTGLDPDNDHPQYALVTYVDGLDHHAVYTDAEAAAKIAADDLYVKVAGDTMTGELVVDNAIRSRDGNLIVADHAGLTYFDIRDSQIFVRVNNDWRFEMFSTGLNPYYDNAMDLGTSSKSWESLYVFNIRDEGGNIRIDTSLRLLDGGTWLVDGSMNPQDDLTHYLGSATATWLRLYVDEIWDRAGVRVIDVEQQVLDNGTWAVDGSLVTQDNNSHALGGTSNRWNAIWISNQASGGKINMANDDYIQYDDTNNEYKFYMDGTLRTILGSGVSRFSGAMLLYAAMATFTTGGYATLRRRDSDGRVLELTSHPDLKIAIKNNPNSRSRAKQLSLAVKSKKYREKGRPEEGWEVGFMSTDVAPVWPEAIHWTKGEDGEPFPMSIHYEKLVVPLFEIAGDHEERLLALEAQ